jgi:chemotaxis signal transduction protein
VQDPFDRPEATDEEDAGVTLLPFRRGASTFAVDVARVRRVVAAGGLRGLPGAPPFARGGIRAGARLEVVVDPDVLFPRPTRSDPDPSSSRLPPGKTADREPVPPTRVLLVGGESDGFGLAADAVDAPAEVPLDAIQDPPPFVGGPRRRAILGLLVRDETEVLILDPDALLEPEVRAELESIGAGPA